MKALLSKISTWVSLQNKNGSLRLLVIASLTWLVCFKKLIIGKTYTSWDTHDIGFVNFLYFSDSLRTGVFPFWNHFIQSGTFFPSFNNVGLFSPFQLVFVTLSWLINPVYAYELMIQTSVLIGGIGAYLLFNTYTTDRIIALFGATAFSFLVLFPIVGQIGFVISLSSFPWLIFICIKIIDDPRERMLSLVIWGVISALYIVSGYLWMNIIQLIVVLFFSTLLIVNKHLLSMPREKKVAVLTIKRLMLFLGTLVLLYGCSQLPGFHSIKFNYYLFTEDYISPEPRLRDISAHGVQVAYGNIFKALIAAIDPRIYMNNTSWEVSTIRWSWGAGWLLWISFLVIPKRRPSRDYLFWMILLILSLMYSAGSGNLVGYLVQFIPIINANRWWNLGSFYVTVFLIYLVVAKLSSFQEVQENFKRYNLRLLLTGAASFFLLIYFKSSAIEYVLVVASLILVYLLVKTKDNFQWKCILTAFIVFNVVSITLMQLNNPANIPYQRDNGYSKQIAERKTDVAIIQNNRQLGSGHDYIFNNEQWLIMKIPFSHGYNNLGNPLYWYVKNEPFLKNLVVLTQDTRQEKILLRREFSSDNQFAEAIMGDVLADMWKPTVDAKHYYNLLQSPDFKWRLNELKMEPNKSRMLVTTNSAAYLIFNNVDHPGWEVYVNGKKTDLIKTNRIFQGVFLQGAGKYEVVFKFRPVLAIALILLPYIVLLLCFIACIKKARTRGRLHAN